MGAVRRKTPGAMPSNATAQGIANRLQTLFLLTGSRGDTAARNPDIAVHGQFRVRGGQLADLAGRRVVVFLHGYNETPRDGIQQSAAFFSRLEASLLRDQRDLGQYAFLAFTWPGDVGPVHFNDAQQFAHHSGTALYRLVNALVNEHHVQHVTLVTHSLGAHVGLRGAAILGERLYHRGERVRFASVLLLAPAVEDDVFHRPERREEYHFPEAAFGIMDLHIFVSRDDDVLGVAFRVNEFDQALGFAGPESLEPLQSLARRVDVVTTAQNDPQRFSFELHDFSTSSPFIMNPNVWARAHADYWSRSDQTDYYVNFIA